ncbi:hypothetical protein HY251_15625 [bacterium]|nr:hypothetical protein [bacterium]
MRARFLTVALLLMLAGCTRPGPPAPAPSPPEKPRGPLRYVALGDSYTKGEAAPPESAWPFLAAQRLRAEGHEVELVANLGVTGFTSRDVLRRQVPELEGLSPDLATLQVGINDYVQGVGEDAFRKDQGALLDALLARDVFSASRDAESDPELLARDGIHPSAKGYAAWVDPVLPLLREACAALKK